MTDLETAPEGAVKGEGPRKTIRKGLPPPPESRPGKCRDNPRPLPNPPKPDPEGVRERIFGFFLGYSAHSAYFSSSFGTDRRRIPRNPGIPTAENLPDGPKTFRPAGRETATMQRQETTTGEYALVTGASSGIGYAFAAQLAARGYGVVLVSNREEENRAAAERIAREYGVATLPLYQDLAQPDAAERLHAETSRRGLKVSVLVSNAGILLFGLLADTPPERLRTIVALHCMTPALLCRLYGDDMRRRGGGRILVVSSSTAWMPWPTIAAYSATKAFLHSFARSLDIELRDQGVNVTTLYPGAVDTPLYSLSERRRQLLVRCGVMLPPDRVARKGLRALFRGRRRCIPGLFTKLCVFFCRLLPAPWLRPILRLRAVRRLLQPRG